MSGETSYRELLVGCGTQRRKHITVLDNDSKPWCNLTTLDVNLDHRPSVVADLNHHSLPFTDNSFDEIHAYEVLEHTGRQGDYRFFFDQFTEFHRVLKLGGVFYASCPSYKSMWAWGDPSHTRVFTSGSLVFLSQTAYQIGMGTTSMSDFRDYYTADFEIVWVLENEETLAFILRTK